MKLGLSLRLGCCCFCWISCPLLLTTSRPYNRRSYYGESRVSKTKSSSSTTLNIQLRLTEPATTSSDDDAVILIAERKKKERKEPSFPPLHQVLLLILLLLLLFSATATASYAFLLVKKFTTFPSFNTNTF